MVSPFFGNGQMSISIAGETGVRSLVVARDLAGCSDDIFPRASGAEIELTSSLRTSVSVEHSGSQPSKRGLDALKKRRTLTDRSSVGTSTPSYSGAIGLQ